MNKKASGSVELNIIIFGLIFMTLLNISLGFILDSNLYETKNISDDISNYVYTGLGATALFAPFLLILVAILSLFFSLFGVSFIIAISVLPLWVSAIILLLNALVIFSIIMYFVERLWIG